MTQFYNVILTSFPVNKPALGVLLMGALLLRGYTLQPPPAGRIVQQPLQTAPGGALEPAQDAAHQSPKAIIAQAIWSALAAAAENLAFEVAQRFLGRAWRRIKSFFTANTN